MPHYLIHVGPHKTGTTYLQLRFDAARQRLEQAGVAYPSEWRSTETEPSHYKLASGLREGRAGLLKSKFEAIERNNPDHVLISAEGLNLLEEPAIALLKTLIGSNPVSIIFYCRRWSELLPSLWQEKVKHGYAAVFPEFLKHHVTDPFASPAMNFARRLNIYAEVFGRQTIKLVSYSNLCDETIDLAEHFLSCFLPEHRRLIDDLPGSTPAWPNRSFPPRDVEVIRALNAMHAGHGMRTDAMLRDWYMRNAGRFDLGELLLSIQENITTLPFSDASPDREGLHDMLFAMYGDLMIPPVASRRLFLPRQAEIVYCEQRYLAEAASLRALGDVYAKFRSETDAVSLCSS